MTALLTYRQPNKVNELRLKITHLQALAARFAREGNVEGARAARAKLYPLLNQADLLKLAS